MDPEKRYICYHNGLLCTTERESEESFLEKTNGIDFDVVVDFYTSATLYCMDNKGTICNGNGSFIIVPILIEGSIECISKQLW